MTLAALTVPSEKTHCRRGHQLTPDNCGEQPERLTQDDVIPLTCGGYHTLLDIVPACWNCNRLKGNREDWTPLRPEELAPL